MNISNAINIFSCLQDQQEESTESNSLSLSLGVGAIAIGIFSSAWYLYPKYLKCSEYRKFCRNLDSWCVKAASIQEKESRRIAINRIKECYWNKSLRLELSSLGLTSLPPEIRELEHLRELDLSGNEFQALPAEIEQLKSLQILNLSKNPFENIFQEIERLKNLHHLSIIYNESEFQIRDYVKFCGGLDEWCEDAFFFEKENRLAGARLMKKCYVKERSELNLFSLDLTTLPPEIGQLTGLRILNLSSNRLENLPSEIWQLAHLQVFGLSGNCLKILPPEIEGLTNLQQLDLSDNPLQNLPPQIGQLQNLDLLIISRITAQNSQQIITTLSNNSTTIKIIPSHKIIQQTWSLGHQQIEDKPIFFLNELWRLTHGVYFFPFIEYENSEAIDIGGPSRDFISKLFREAFDKNNPLLPVQELDSCFLPVIAPEFSYIYENDKPYNTQSLYQIVGAIFGVALQKAPPVVLGSYFHPVLFEMLFTLSEGDITHLPDTFNAWNDLSEHTDVLQKLLTIYLISRWEGPWKEREKNASKLAHAFVQDQFPDFLGLYQSKEEFLEDYPNIDKIILGTLAIAQGMHGYLKNWNLQSSSARDLLLNIQGFLSRQEILDALSWEEGENIEQNAQVKEYLQQWIEDETTSFETLLLFFFALTGSVALIKGQKLKVSFFSAENEPSETTEEWFPHYHTCDYSMHIPRNYPDYATFKRYLEASIRAAEFGFQVK